MRPHEAPDAGRGRLTSDPEPNHVVTAGPDFETGPAVDHSTHRVRQWAGRLATADAVLVAAVLAWAVDR